MDSLHLVGCLLNAFLSYTSTMLNIVTIHAIRKTPSLSKNLKTLLLSLAVSDLGVGLVAQPLYVARLIMESQLNIETSKTYNAIYIAYLVSGIFFGFATMFLVIVLCAERFIAIHYYLRYQELVTHTFFSVRIYSSVRLHVNQMQVLQLQHAPQNAQMVNVRRMQKCAMMSVYVCLVLMVCYLPTICTLFAIASTSRPSTSIKHLQFYTLTLVFLNSSLNPVIYCWKMKHIRHTIIGLIRNAFTKQN